MTASTLQLSLRSNNFVVTNVSRLSTTSIQEWE
jgi:hypothetical protein